MVLVRRLSPEDGVSRIFKGLSGRVQSLETRASGNVVIRETLSTTDPETGVETIIGQLPDGGYGIQEFINDVTPPGQPTAPSLTPALGALTVVWDGHEVGGTTQPKDYARTEVLYRTSGSGAWTLGGVFYGASSILVSGLTPGVQYEIRLVSYDQNNNASTPSGTVSETAAAIMDNSDVADAIDAVQREATKASQDSANAQEAAAAAEEAAATAAEEAAKAVGLAAGGSGIIFADTAPTEAKDRTANKLWIDTSGTPAKNTPNRWIDGKWVAVTDKAAIDAASKAGAAESSANAAAASAAAAATAAGNAQTAANGKNRSWYAASAPAGTAHTVGDTWFNTANGNEPNRWDGGRWLSVRDATIATAKQAADSKSATYWGTTKPTGGIYQKGDTWFDTANGYALWTHDGSVWVKTQDTATAKAEAATDATAKANAAQAAAITAAQADAKAQTEAAEARVAKTASDDAQAKATAAQTAALAAAKTYADAQASGAQGAALEAAKTDATTKANAAQAAAIAAAALDATAKKEEAERVAAVEAQRLANVALEAAKSDAATKVATKNKTWMQTSRPALTGNVIGDTWIDTSTAGGNKLNVWNGAGWVAAQDSAISAALSAANGKNKIIFSDSDASGTTGYVAGDMWMKRDATGTIIGQWEFTTSWQKRTISETVLGNISAGKLTSGIVAADRLDSNTIRSKIIDADDISAVDILASGSITATNGIIGSIDAAKISVGLLDAARIAAQSLTADKVIIGQGANLLTDPSFVSAQSNTDRASRSTGTWTFAIDTGTGINSAKTTTTVTNSAFYFGIPKASAANAANMIPVTPGEKYLLSANTYTNISAGVRWNVETVSANGTAGYVSASPTSTAVGRRPVEFEYVVPAGVVAFNPVLACLTSGVTWVIDGGAIATRKTEGKLIVDGAIDGKTITGALIQSESAVNRGIKINGSGLIGYNSTGVETLRFDGINSIITGAVYRTAATGARVQLDSTGLAAWGATNNEIFRINNGSVTMQGSISARGVTQEINVPATPSRPISLSLGPSMPVYQGGLITEARVPGIQWVTEGVMMSPPQLYSASGDGVTLSGGVNGANQFGSLTMYNGLTQLVGSSSTYISANKGTLSLVGGSGIEMSTGGGVITSGTKVLNGETEVWSFGPVWAAQNEAAGPGYPDYVWGTDDSRLLGLWVAPDQYRFKETGFYAIDFFIDMVSYVAAGWMSLSRGTATSFAESNFSNAGAHSLTIASARMAANEVLRIRFLQNAKAQNMNGYIAIRRVA